MSSFIQSGLSVFYMLGTELGAERKQTWFLSSGVEIPVNRGITQMEVKSHLRYPGQRKGERVPENLQYRT